MNYWHLMLLCFLMIVIAMIVVIIHRRYLIWWWISYDSQVKKQTSLKSLTLSSSWGHLLRSIVCSSIIKMIYSYYAYACDWQLLFWQLSLIMIVMIRIEWMILYVWDNLQVNVIALVITNGKRKKKDNVLEMNWIDLFICSCLDIYIYIFIYFYTR